MGKPKAKIPKRRSMFRSPGTASSPDLATLVRRAKEAKASAPSGVVTAVQPTPDPNGSPAPRHARQAPPVSHMPSSQSVGLGLSAASGSGMRAASTSAPGQEQIAAAASRAQGKGGPVKSVSGGSEEWDKFSVLKSFGSASPDKMATIAERPGSSRSRESSHDGSKVRGESFQPMPLLKLTRRVCATKQKAYSVGCLAVHPRESTLWVGARANLSSMASDPSQRQARTSRRPPGSTHRTAPRHQYRPCPTLTGVKRTSGGMPCPPHWPRRVPLRLRSSCNRLKFRRFKTSR